MLLTFPLTDFDNALQRHLTGQVWDNKYYYLNQLMALDACRPLCEDSTVIASRPIG